MTLNKLRSITTFSPLDRSLSYGFLSPVFQQFVLTWAKKDTEKKIVVVEVHNQCKGSHKGSNHRPSEIMFVLTKEPPPLLVRFLKGAFIYRFPLIPGSFKSAVLSLAV